MSRATSPRKSQPHQHTLAQSWFSRRFGLRSLVVVGFDFGGGEVVEFAVDAFLVTLPPSYRWLLEVVEAPLRAAVGG